MHCRAEHYRGDHDLVGSTADADRSAPSFGFES
jgi:hypothetical protein